ncbi:MAG: SurA N-terminal domain-containing protein, partial [Arenibacter algicola]|nr:SurA N-terminal domain-containing protein [Arenibacter algicola]
MHATITAQYYIEAEPKISPKPEGLMLHFNRRSFLSLFILLAIACGTALPMGQQAAAQTASTDGTLGIAAVVNDDVISMLDLETRVNLVVATTNMPDTEETRARIRPQILRGLIDEKLMLQEAKRVGINVTQPEIEQGMANIAQANGTGVEEFKQLLSRWGVPVAAMSARVEADIAWQTYIRKTLAR